MTTMNEERARVVDAMCMTWRHDFGLDRKDDELGSCGMTDAERDALRRQMGQLYDHHFVAWQRAQGAVPHPLRYTNDGELAECPCCGSLDVGGAHDTVNCYGCGLQITKPRPLQNAVDAWNKRAMLYAAPSTPAAQLAVPEGWQLVPVEPTAEMMMHESSCQHHAADDMSCPVRRTRRNIFARMLAAAPTVKAEQAQCEFHGDDSSACEKYSGNVPCEPAPAHPAERQEQGEVQGLRDWIACTERLPADKRDVMVYCADSDEHMVGSSIGGGLFLFATASHGEKIVCRPTHWRHIDESDKPDLAASTGQEVES